MMPYLGCGISDFDSSELGNASVVHNTHAVIHPHLAQCPIVQLLVDGFRGRLSAKAVVSLPARIRVLFFPGRTSSMARRHSSQPGPLCDVHDGRPYKGVCHRFPWQ